MTIGRGPIIYRTAKLAPKLSKERCEINLGYGLACYRLELYGHNAPPLTSMQYARGGGAPPACRTHGAGNRPALRVGSSRHVELRREYCRQPPYGAGRGAGDVHPFLHRAIGGTGIPVAEGLAVSCASKLHHRPKTFAYAGRGRDRIGARAAVS